MFGRLDFTVYDPAGQPRLAVEAKRILDRSEEWATSWRRNVMEDAPASFAECVHMLVTPDRIFMWEAGAAPGDAPAEEFDAEEHLGPYFRRVNILPADIEHRAFEHLVSWWLRDLTETSLASDLDAAAQELEDAGLLQLLVGARVVQDNAA